MSRPKWYCFDDSIRTVTFKEATPPRGPALKCDLSSTKLYQICHNTAIRTEFLRNNITQRCFVIKTSEKIHIISILQVPNIMYIWTFYQHFRQGPSTKDGKIPTQFNLQCLLIMPHSGKGRFQALFFKCRLYPVLTTSQENYQRFSSYGSGKGRINVDSTFGKIKLPVQSNLP